MMFGHEASPHLIYLGGRLIYYDGETSWWQSVFMWLNLPAIVVVIPPFILKSLFNIETTELTSSWVAAIFTLGGMVMEWQFVGYWCERLFCAMKRPNAP
jgi:hypothetical protein